METWEVFGTFLMHEKAKLVASDEFLKRPLQEQIEGWTLAVGISCHLNSSEKAIDLATYMFHSKLLLMAEGDTLEEKTNSLGVYLKKMSAYLPVAQDETKTLFERYQASLKCYIARLAHIITHQGHMSEEDKHLFGELAFHYIIEEAQSLASEGE